MARDLRRRWRGGRGCAWSCGWGGFVFVLVVGGILSLANVVVGVGVSVGVPFTSANLTLAGGIGARAKAVDALPGYARGRLGGNQDFINQSQTLTIGPAEGAAIVLIGNQPGAPPIDLHLVAR